MTRIRSPGYPSVNLAQALVLVEKIFSASRQNTIDREAAAKDIGYSGMTGQSAKMLSNLSHFGLIERAGKGGVRVTDIAVRILHPRSADERNEALRDAAFHPDLFRELHENFPDGHVSENALRGYLMREGFASVAVQPAVRSFMETYELLQEARATESHGQAARPSEDAADARGGHVVAAGADVSRSLVPSPPDDRSRAAAVPQVRNEGVRVMEGERVVFVEESGPSQYLKVIANGDMDESLLEALEDYVARQKKRLERNRETGG
jgi:hypothetical protein